MRGAFRTARRVRRSEHRPAVLTNPDAQQASVERHHSSVTAQLRCARIALARKGPYPRRIRAARPTRRGLAEQAADRARRLSGQHGANWPWTVRVAKGCAPAEASPALANVTMDPTSANTHDTRTDEPHGIPPAVTDPRRPPLRVVPVTVATTCSPALTVTI
jgi:hypothetical protein